MDQGGSSPPAGNSGTRKQMALFGVEFPGFRGLRKVSDLKIFVVCVAATFWSRMDGAWIFWGEARRELPGSRELGNQDANGPFWESSFQVFRVSDKFQIWKSSRCASLPFIGLERTVPKVLSVPRCPFFLLGRLLGPTKKRESQSWRPFLGALQMPSYPLFARCSSTGCRGELSVEP